MKEIANMMDRDEARNRTTKSRSELTMFNIEVKATESEDEDQEHLYNISQYRQ